LAGDWRMLVPATHHDKGTLASRVGCGHTHIHARQHYIKLHNVSISFWNHSEAQSGDSFHFSA
jgi:hypothetical protein